MAITPAMEQAPGRRPIHATAFICDFVRRCFTEDLCEVDFTQSLTAMGYLQDLEEKRKNELHAAMKRLDVDQELLAQDRLRFEIIHPGIYEWIVTTEAQAKKVEQLYTQVYVGLRRWTLINEMRLEPFSKPNCISMLNILYPPTYGEAPTSQLTANTLNAQRNAYFKYIQAVEKSGKDVLITLEQASRRSGEINGWSVVRDIVDVYLRKASKFIDDCRTAKSSKDFVVVNKDKRTDSGISLSSTSSDMSYTEKKVLPTIRPDLVHRPATSAGNPATASPMSAQAEYPTPVERKNSGFGYFTRRLKARSAEARSVSPPQLEKQPSFTEKRPGLHKSKSYAVLPQGKHSRENSSDRSTLPQFTIDDAQRERLIREARQDKANTPVKRQPSPAQYIYRPKTRDAHLVIPEEASPTSCRITRFDDHRDPYRLPSLILPSLRV